MNTTVQQPQDRPVGEFRLLLDALVGEPLSWVFGPSRRARRSVQPGELTAAALDRAVSWLGLVHRDSGSGRR